MPVAPKEFVLGAKKKAQETLIKVRFPKSTAGSDVTLAFCKDIYAPNRQGLAQGFGR